MQAVSATRHETARMAQDQMQEQKTIYPIYVNTLTRHPKTTTQRQQRHAVPRHCLAFPPFIIDNLNFHK